MFAENTQAIAAIRPEMERIEQENGEADRRATVQKYLKLAG